LTGYIRQDTLNLISNGTTVDALPLDQEFDALQSTFAAVGGHKHDGTTGEGAPITVVGPVQDLVVSGSSVSPKTDNTLDLGTASLEFKDLYIDGVANIDSLVADAVDINSGTIDGTTIGATTPSTGVFTTLVATTLTGNATTASTLQTPRTISLGGDATGSVSFNGSANVSITTTVVDNSHNHLLANVTDAGTMAAQNASGVTITGGSITGITDLAITDGGTGASTATDARTNLGLGSMAVQNSGSVTITGGSITGITDIAVADGGTGSSTPSGARTNLGLVIGTDVQAYDNDLAALAALATTGLTVRTGAGTVASRSVAAGTAISVSNGDGVSGNPTISVTGVTTAEIAAATLVTASETIASNINDTTLPTSAAVYDALPFKKSFTSTDQTITPAGLVTLAHGLGAVPTLLQFFIKCTSADGGFAVNDLVVAAMNNSTGAARNNSCYVDSTNINVRYSDTSAPFTTANKSTGASVTLDPTKWVLIVKAWA